MREFLLAWPARGACFLRKHPALFAAILATGMVLGIYVAMGIWPFGQRTVITGDLNGQYIPYFAHYQRFFQGEAGFFYGFDKSMGGPLVALFAYYVASPLNLLYLLVPVQWFAALAAFLFGLKVVFAASFMSLFLHHKFPKLGLLGVVPALGYAFSAYVFVYAQNIMWHDVLFLLPLVCLALERMLKGKGLLLYSVALALMTAANFYIAFMACIFLVFYVLCYFVLQKPQDRKIIQNSVRFIGGSLLGAGLVAVLLAPTVFNLNSSKGELLGYSFSGETQFALWSLPERLAFHNFEWPQVIDGDPFLYCGLVLPLLALCFFISPAIRARAKLCAGAVLAVLVLSFWIKGLDTVWHGLAEPVWFLYRYSWIFVFVLAMLSAAALAYGAVGKKTLVLTALGMAGIFLLLGPVSQTAGMIKLALSALGVLGYGVVLWFCQNGKKENLRNVAATGLILVVCAELSLSGFLISRKFEPYPLQTYQNFIDQVGGVMHTQQEENLQYRVEKNFYRTMNDPMLLDYHGISHFGSTQDNASTDTLWNLGYRGNGSYLYGSTAFSDSVLALTRLLADDSRAVPAHWEENEETEVGTLYENPYVMPLLFTVPPIDTGEELVQWENSFSYQNELYRILTGGHEEPLLQEVEQVQRQLEGVELDGLLGQLPAGGEYVLNAQEAGYYYALAVSEIPYMDVDWLLNGEVAGKVFSADQNGVLNLGYHEPGDEIRLGFGQGGDLVVSEIYFACLPQEAMAELAQQAEENSGDFSIEDGHVTGTVQAVSGREMLFTSIPYDVGWQATVNGQEVEPGAVLGSFLAVPLQQGENAVVLAYHPPGLALGAGLSVVSLLIFCVLFALGYWRQRKQIQST